MPWNAMPCHPERVRRNYREPRATYELYFDPERDRLHVFPGYESVLIQNPAYREKPTRLTAPYFAGDGWSNRAGAE